MTATLTGSMTATPISTAGKLSSARGGSVTVRVRDLGDFAGCYVAVGKSAVVPATYADWDTDFGGQSSGIDASVQSQYNPDLHKWDSVTFTVPVPPAQVSAGDDLYIGVFEGVPSGPGPTDAPSAVVGPFTGIA